MDKKFGLWKKWFWVGIVVGLLNIIAGFVYGIALVSESDRKKEGIVTIVWSFVWGVSILALSYWLRLYK